MILTTLLRSVSDAIIEMSLKIDNAMTTILTMVGFYIFLFSLHHWTPRMNYKSHTLTIKIGHKNLVYVYQLYVEGLCYFTHRVTPNHTESLRVTPSHTESHRVTPSHSESHRVRKLI